MVQDAWWMQLNDQKLNQLVALSIRNAPDLRIAKARFEQAQAQLGITEAANKMQIGLSARGQEHMLLLSLHPVILILTIPYYWQILLYRVLGSFDFWGKNRKQAASILGKRKAIL